MRYVVQGWAIPWRPGLMRRLRWVEIEDGWLDVPKGCVRAIMPAHACYLVDKRRLKRIRRRARR